MYCSKCGNESLLGSEFCRSCGAETDPFLSYDYKVATFPKGRAAEAEDVYRALGWEIADRKDRVVGRAVTLRRARNVENKDRLIRTERKLEDALDEETLLEKKKTGRAKIAAGFTGTIAALVFGGGMCLCLLRSALGAILAGCALGVLGAGLGALAYFIFRKVAKKTTAEANALLEAKRGEIAGLLEEARQCRQ